jgi:hypothetical protein
MLSPQNRQLHIPRLLRRAFAYVRIVLPVRTRRQFSVFLGGTEEGDFGGVMFAFSFGVAGAFLYVWTDIKKNTVHNRGDPFQWISVFGRVTFFLVATFTYTILVVCLFWYMFSGTDQVVHGEYAPLHILSWTGFALFAGIFLGLIGRTD